MPSLDERLDRLAEVRKEAEVVLRLSKEKMKKQFERNKKSAHIFNIGDMVWLMAKDIVAVVPYFFALTSFFFLWRLSPHATHMDAMWKPCGSSCSPYSASFASQITGYLLSDIPRQSLPCPIIPISHVTTWSAHSLSLV